MSFWKKSFINYFSATFAVITIVVAIVITAMSSWSFWQSFLQAMLFINIGLRGLIAFAGNWFSSFSKEIALEYGWEEDNTYQKEIASADAAFGVLGLFSVFFQGGFWIATILGSAVCWLLSEYANLVSIYGKLGKKASPGEYRVSTRVFVGMHIDVFMAVFSLVALLFWSHST